MTAVKVITGIILFRKIISEHCTTIIIFTIALTRQ